MSHTYWTTPSTPATRPSLPVFRLLVFTFCFIHPYRCLPGRSHPLEPPPTFLHWKAAYLAVQTRSDLGAGKSISYISKAIPWSVVTGSNTKQYTELFRDDSTYLSLSLSEEEERWLACSVHRETRVRICLVPRLRNWTTSAKSGLFLQTYVGKTTTCRELFEVLCNLSSDAASVPPAPG